MNITMFRSMSHLRLSIPRNSCMVSSHCSDTVIPITEDVISYTIFAQLCQFSCGQQSQPSAINSPGSGIHPRHAQRGEKQRVTRNAGTKVCKVQYVFVHRKGVLWKFNRQTKDTERTHLWEAHEQIPLKITNIWKSHYFMFTSCFNDSDMEIPSVVVCQKGIRGRDSDRSQPQRTAQLKRESSILTLVLSSIS